MSIAERTRMIWIPEDDIDLLAVSAMVTDESVVQGMIKINQAARDWLEGKISLADYCDIMQENGISNPFEIVGEFCDHTELIIKARL